MLKTTVIYHSADFDGLFCREIAKKFLPDVELIGWNFGDKPLPFPDPETRYFVLDLPMDEPFGLKFEDGWLARDNPLQEKEYRQIQPIDRIDFQKQWVWIDHHGSSIARHPKEIPGYRIDGVAACRLAWQWFDMPDGWDYSQTQPPLPGKQDFIDRKVGEPYAVRLAGEYDIWDKRDPNADIFQMGLRSQELTPQVWKDLLDREVPESLRGTGMEVTPSEQWAMVLINQGVAVQYAKTHENESIIKHAGFTLQWEGLTFLAVNHARYNSFLFTAGLKPEHDACYGFAYRNGQWTV